MYEEHELMQELGDDHEVVQREISAIQELLDEQPDSKCEAANATRPRCLLTDDNA